MSANTSCLGLGILETACTAPDIHLLRACDKAFA
jgi:hypothetical protein